jgi:hypothetical protein
VTTLLSSIILLNNLVIMSLTAGAFDRNNYIINENFSPKNLIFHSGHKVFLENNNAKLFTHLANQNIGKSNNRFSKLD